MRICLGSSGSKTDVQHKWISLSINVANWPKFRPQNTKVAL
jgi:hypothetical protein